MKVFGPNFRVFQDFEVFSPTVAYEIWSNGLLLLLFCSQLEKLISKNYFLNMSGKEAFKAYVRAYDSHHLKQIFDIDTMDLSKVALSFGFTVPPAVDLSILYYYVQF